MLRFLSSKDSTGVSSQSYTFDETPSGSVGMEMPGGTISSPQSPTPCTSTSLLVSHAALEHLDPAWVKYRCPKLSDWLD